MEGYHHLFELMNVNKSIVVFIELFYEILPLTLGYLLLGADCPTHYRLKLFYRYLPRVLLVII